MRPVKKLAVTSAVAMLSLGMTACGSNSTNNNSSAPAGNSGASGSSGGSAAGALKVGLAYDVGGRGDHSFNDSAAKGLDEAKAEFGIKPTEVAATNGENDAARVSRLQQLAQSGNQAIVAVGFSYAAAIGKVAKQFPNVKFAIIDDASPDSKGDNIDQITFTEEQGSYLAGAAAALKSKSGHIGFVGGVEVPLIKKFQAGYVAGAKKVNPNIKIDSTYLTQAPDFSGFADPAKGKTAAQGMFQNGADIVYHAAGKSGDGVFDAAKAAGSGKWAIGVDSDQAQTAPAGVRPIILTSMLKGVDVGVKSFLKKVHDGNFKGGNSVYALKDGGVSLATTGGHIDDIKAKLDELKKGIEDGSIKVPSA
ncbi:BMP family protein [Yimella sp. cx-51]|uniref:BMP family lipoprotein n=1 Tax=Yimella sp. cx-51 TaxID=2770551 RepID=UPI00165D5C7F|nr:BMP family ABC transporter substrate-binding protein [Yimella sp. cx-51]MBC9958179.1 BMP family ABC transporter substrate-binding protein [Yimella sp. cx-51]MBD2758963.1 BMP family ABC transporter substrate-binding protein [Yimella sp. cx-573]QTH38786.1 BMP family ABC transporter substrate-binding protein [Yimella sp. cx-51]